MEIMPLYGTLILVIEDIRFRQSRPAVDTIYKQEKSADSLTRRYGNGC